MTDGNGFRLSLLSKAQRGLGAFLILLTLVAPARADIVDKYYAPPGRVHASMRVVSDDKINLSLDFKNATASFEIGDAPKTLDKFRFAIDANSLDSSLGTSMNTFQAILNILQYPEISFIQTEPATFDAQNKAIVKGLLTMRRVAKPIELSFLLQQGSSPLAVTVLGNTQGPDPDGTDAKRTRQDLNGDLVLNLEMQAVKQ